MLDSNGAVPLRESLDRLLRSPEDFRHNLMFPPPEKIRVYDDTLRDGEQMPGVAFSPDVKYEIARRLSDIGVHCMDVGFPAVSPGERRTLQLVLDGKRRGELREDLEIVCMMRATRSDIETTIRTVEELGAPPDAITYLIFTSGSDLHIKYKLGQSLLHREGRSASDWLRLPVAWYRDANERMVTEAISYARALGAREIEFGAEDGSRADLNYLVELHDACQVAGATRAVLADTVGCYSPYAAAEQVARVRRALPDLPLGVHFHNDLGIGAWNTVVGLGNGADYFMTSVNGIGERAGNAPMHQVLMQLRYLFGIELPGFKYDRLRELARFLECVSGIVVQATEPGIGQNVFSHESGIHTAGMLIHPSIYQFIPPEDLGARIEYVYGKHSGTLSIEHALRRANLATDRETVLRVLAEVKRIREEQAEREDFADFQDEYYQHLIGMGVPVATVLELGRLIARPEHIQKAS
jgi:2-isopropylmalate synthase